MKLTKYFMAYYSIVILFCLYITSCQEQPSKNNSVDYIPYNEIAPPPQTAEEQTMGLVCTLGSDLTAGYAGAKAGAVIGAFFGPIGAALGGVIGCTIAGAGASYYVGKNMSGGNGGNSGNGGNGGNGGNNGNSGNNGNGGKKSFIQNPNMPLFPYNTYEIGQANQAGYLHNELLKILCEDSTIVNDDNSLNLQKMYDISIQFLIQEGFENPSQYFSFTEYQRIMNEFANINSKVPLLNYISNESLFSIDEKLYVNTIINNIFDIQTFSDSFNKLSELYINRNTEQLNDLNYNYALQVGFYSYSFWALNNFYIL